VGARPTTRYARSGEYSIAYQVVGDAPLDLVLVAGFVSHVEYAWDESAERREAFRGMTDDEMFSDRQAFAVGVSITAVALLTVLVCVPYWRAIGIL
jgi:hypothetical protein